MPAKLSKEVTDRFRAALFVLSAFRLQGPRVAASLLTLIRPELVEGDEEPGFLAPIVGLSRQLRGAVKRLVAADEQLRTASAREGTLRYRRGRRSHALGRQIIGLRRIIAGHYVAPDLDGLGLQPLLRRDPTTLVRRARAIVQAFRSEDAAEMLGEASFERGLEPGSHAEELVPVLAELGAIVEEVNAAKRSVEQARAAKHQAMASYDEIFRRTTRVFEELCRLAGEGELADKVRASSTYPGRTVEEPEEVPDDVLDLEDLTPPGGHSGAERTRREPVAEIREPDAVTVREPQAIGECGSPGKERETIVADPPGRPGGPGRRRSSRAPPVRRCLSPPDLTGEHGLALRHEHGRDLQGPTCLRGPPKGGKVKEAQALDAKTALIPCLRS